MFDKNTTASILVHMNEHHADAILDYVHAYTSHSTASKAQLTGLDSTGMDISCQVLHQQITARVNYPTALTSADQIRSVLVAMAMEARQRQ